MIARPGERSFTFETYKCIQETEHDTQVQEERDDRERVLRVARVPGAHGERRVFGIILFAI